MVSRTLRQCATGPSSPNSSTERTTLSNATHAMTLEWVKCRLSPRISQNPWSGCCQIVSRCLTSAHSNAQVAALGWSPALRATYRASMTSPFIELHLPRGRITDTHGGRLFVAWQPGEFAFFQAALAGDAVHDLQIGRAAGNRAQQPSPPCPRLLRESRTQQRVQREGGVAQPAAAIIPIAAAAYLFR